MWRRILAAIRQRFRRARYRLTVEPPAWADEAPVTELVPLDPFVIYQLDTFRG